MENIAFDDSEAIQLDALSMDSSLHTSADGHFFGKDVALNLCAIADRDGRGVELALDTSGNSHKTGSFMHALNAAQIIDEGKAAEIMRSMIIVRDGSIALKTEATEPDFLSFGRYVCGPFTAVFVDTFVM